MNLFLTTKELVNASFTDLSKIGLNYIREMVSAMIGKGDLQQKNVFLHGDFIIVPLEYWSPIYVVLGLPQRSSCLYRESGTPCPSPDNTLRPRLPVASTRVSQSVTVIPGCLVQHLRLPRRKVFFFYLKLDIF